MKDCKLVFLLILISCASSDIKYTPPIKPDKKLLNITNIHQDYEKSWSNLVEKLSETTYSLDHINKNSGFININFDIDEAQKFVDCGRYQGYFKNMSGSQEINFNGAAKTSHYGGVTRGTSLTGKVNLYLKRVSSSESQLKVNILYNFIVRGTQEAINANFQRKKEPFSYSVSFSTHSIGEERRGNITVKCVSTGELEKYFLNL